MKVAYTYPPNYAEICRSIPAVKLKRNIIFTYGDTIYNPGRAGLPDHLMAHEEIHSAEQTKMGVTDWWDNYLSSPAFRLDEELKAYRQQYRVLARYGAKLRKAVLFKISTDLAGPMYGKIVSKDEARKLIMEGSI